MTFWGEGQGWRSPSLGREVEVDESPNRGLTIYIFIYILMILLRVKGVNLPVQRGHSKATHPHRKVPYISVLLRPLGVFLYFLQTFYEIAVWFFICQ